MSKEDSWGLWGAMAGQLDAGRAVGEGAAEDGTFKLRTIRWCRREITGGHSRVEKQHG